MLKISQHMSSITGIDSKLKNQKGLAMINMMVLLFIVITLSTVVAAAVSFTARTSSDSDTALRAKSAAEAGIDRAYYELYTALNAGIEDTLTEIQNNNPEYKVEFNRIEDGSIEIVSTGSYQNETSRISATISYEVNRHGNDSGGTSDLEFYSSSNITFNGGDIRRPPTLTSPIINLEHGNLNCQGSGLTFNGNIVLWDGNLNFAHTNCRGIGDVYINGDANFTQYCNGIQGNLYVTGNVTFTGGCPINGNLYAGGYLDIGVNGMTISGNVFVNGNISVAGNTTFGGNVTTNGSVKARGNQVNINGNLVSSSTATDFYFGLNQYNPYLSARNINIAGYLSSTSGPPNTTGAFLQGQNIPETEEPRNLLATFPYKPEPWYSYAKPENLNGYQWMNLSCSEFSSANAPGWNRLAQITEPTVFDLGNCNVNASWSSTPFRVNSDVMIFASAFQLQNAQFLSTPGKEVNIYFIVPDDLSPGAQCISTHNTSDLQGVKIGSATDKSISAMLYSPCGTTLRWGEAWWRGVIYSNVFVIDTQATLDINPMPLPGAQRPNEGINNGGNSGEAQSIRISVSSKQPR